VFCSVSLLLKLRALKKRHRRAVRPDTIYVRDSTVRLGRDHGAPCRCHVSIVLTVLSSLAVGCICNFLSRSEYAITTSERFSLMFPGITRVRQAQGHSAVHHVSNRHRVAAPNFLFIIALARAQRNDTEPPAGACCTHRSTRVVRCVALISMSRSSAAAMHMAGFTSGTSRHCTAAHDEGSQLQQTPCAVGRLSGVVTPSIVAGA
jgi:hypothetical protein